jgi:hypothetical protein
MYKQQLGSFGTFQILTVLLNILNQPIICEGESATIKMNGSEMGVNYQLRINIDNIPVGFPVSGTGNPILFSVNPASNNYL